MEQMINELLKPRYKVIAKFPASGYIVGDLLKPHPMYGFEIYPYPEQYPHLFKKLEWWEDRETEIKYVKLIEDVPYYNLKKNEVFEVDKIHDPFIDLTRGGKRIKISAVTPATEEDFLNQNNK